jgi:hypothetical protein
MTNKEFKLTNLTNLTNLMNSYTYKGLQYKLKDNDLELLRLAAPMLIKYRKLLYEYTKDIDLTELEEYRTRIYDIKTAISQHINDEDDEIGKQLIRTLTIAEKEFSDNAKIQSLMSLYADCEGLVLLEIISDINFIKPFIKRILIGDTEKLNFEDDEILKLIRDAVSDFFIITSRSRFISAA